MAETETKKASEETPEQEETQDQEAPTAEEAPEAADAEVEEAEEEAQPEAEAEAPEAAEAETEETAEAEEAEASEETAPTSEAEEVPSDEAEEAEDAEATEEQGPEHKASIEELLKAGAHFGHLTSRWHPRMEKYIFMERNNIHIIDLMQTQVLLDEAADAARRFAERGKEILFVGTKKQAQEIVRRHAEECEQPHMVNRWLGGTMTNFQTIQRSIRRMEDIERMEKDGTLDKLKKKERLIRLREHEKLENVLGGIRNMAHLPGAVYVVDVKRENIAVSEANKLGIPIIAMTDTNCDPGLVDHPIPANDDALSSIELVTSIIAQAIKEGTSARQAEQEAKKQAQKEKAKA